MEFVRHYTTRHDGVLPLRTSYATIPMVLADGALLAPTGLDRARGIQFLIPDELRAIVPRKEVHEERVKEAVEFLCDQWLVDVATDFTGKATLIALALTLIERILLTERPCFSITAGRRGNGKTTTIMMLTKAVTGETAAAAAWSPNEEERRKSIMAYFLRGIEYILWDNIPRGIQISCPHIERSCTAATYTDRVLGVSETSTVSAATIHIFTGNNIGAKGDLASRTLNIRLGVDRADPENREFKHTDPVGWTMRHRGEILSALYTVLLGNPQLKEVHDAGGKTRFKLWWRLVGSAVEHAVKLAELKAADAPKAVGETVDFKRCFWRRSKTKTRTRRPCSMCSIFCSRNTRRRGVHGGRRDRADQFPRRRRRSHIARVLGPGGGAALRVLTENHHPGAEAARGRAGEKRRAHAGVAEAKGCPLQGGSLPRR